MKIPEKKMGEVSFQRNTDKIHIHTYVCYSDGIGSSIIWNTSDYFRLYTNREIGSRDLSDGGQKLQRKQCEAMFAYLLQSSLEIGF